MTKENASTMPDRNAETSPLDVVVRVSRETHGELIKLQTQRRIELSRPVPLGEIVRELVSQPATNQPQEVNA